MKFLKWGYKNHIEDITGLESFLDDSLQPVKPRPDFVRRLRYQIASQYEPIREEVKEQQHRTVLLVGASVVSGLLTLAVGIRIVMTLIAAVAMLLQWKKSLPPQQAIAARRIS